MGNTIRILHSRNSNFNFEDKVFELSSVEFNKGLFDRKSCKVEFNVSDEDIKSVHIMDRTLVCEIALTDGSRYLVSDISRMSTMPSTGSEQFFGYNINNLKEFKVEMCFDSWTVTRRANLIYNLTHKDEICSVESFDIGKHLEFQAIASLSEKIEAWRKQLADQVSVGLDLGQGESQTATTIAEGEKFKSIKYQYTYTKRDVDKLFNEDKPYIYETDPSVYRALWVDPSKVYTIKVDDTDKKDVNDLSKEEFKELVQKINKEKEKDIMKINGKDLKIIIDEDRKTVTAITTDEQSDMAQMLHLDPEKHVTVAKASKEDEFDPYVGVAMTLAYQLFGSKESFRKFVRENEAVKNLKKEREAREAAKKEAQEKAEEANKRAAAKRAKKAAKRAELRQAKLDATIDVLADALAKRLTKKPKTKKTKTEKGE